MLKVLWIVELFVTDLDPESYLQSSKSFRAPSPDLIKCVNFSTGARFFELSKGNTYTVRHVTGTGSGLLGEIPRVVVQKSALT